MFDIFANCFSFIETVTEVLIYFPPFWNTGQMFGAIGFKIKAMSILSFLKFDRFKILQKSLKTQISHFYLFLSRRPCFFYWQKDLSRLCQFVSNKSEVDTVGEWRHRIRHRAEFSVTSSSSFSSQIQFQCENGRNTVGLQPG